MPVATRNDSVRSVATAWMGVCGNIPPKHNPKSNINAGNTNRLRKIT